MSSVAAVLRLRLRDARVMDAEVSGHLCDDEVILIGRSNSTDISHAEAPNCTGGPLLFDGQRFRSEEFQFSVRIGKIHDLAVSCVELPDQRPSSLLGV